MSRVTFVLGLICATGIVSSNCFTVANLISFSDKAPELARGSISVDKTKVILLDLLKQRFKRDGHSYSYEHEPEEQDCSRGRFWHIRSHRCVPLRCKGGNLYRDVKTGECIVGLLHTYLRHGAPKTVWRSNFNKSKNPVRYPLPRFKG